MLVPTTTYAQGYKVTTITQHKNDHSNQKLDERRAVIYRNCVNAKVQELVDKYPDATKEDLFPAVVAYNVQLFPEEFSSSYLEKIENNSYVGNSMVDYISGNTENERRFVCYDTNIPMNQFVINRDMKKAYVSLDQISFEIAELMSYIAYSDFVEETNSDYNVPISKCLEDLTAYSRGHQELLETNPFIASKVESYYEFINYQNQKHQEFPVSTYSKK